MFDLFRSPEDKTEEIERKITELVEQNQKLNQQTDNIWRELKVTPAQMAKLLSDPINFTEQNWQEIQTQKNLFLDQLKKDLNAIQNPLKAKKSRKEQSSTSPHWLYVK